MIDPDLLSTDLAETGRFSGAVWALRLRQSTVSQRIKRFEATVGDACSIATLITWR